MKLLSVPILMKLEPASSQFSLEDRMPDLDSDIIQFCTEECRQKYIQTHREYTEENFFFETITDDGPDKGMVTCSECKETKMAPE